ncbi:Hvo_1808 family surface protein [Halorubellus sp. PRR65]|uniref:Hvo_1808 family surface protein n=1 Tax=Halorubellus sp. PRR65 TaxID=3098148 RepID=UPI002B25B853|nr:Hvo_1808 family surface protein [Halorubellus sp. PRR65]
MKRLATVLVVLAVVLAGCNAPGGPAATTDGATDATTVPDTTSTAPGTTTTSGDDAPADPSEDVLGWEDGVWANESIDVDQSDGLTDAEIEAFVSRAMARVEVIRNKEFKQRVPVDVVPRSEYANQSSGAGTPKAQSDWNNQVWEALFISSEERNVTQELSQFYSSGVGGYYSSTEDAIVIISDNPETPVISNATLIHELQHALQDQYFNLSQSTYSAPTQDAGLAVDGIVEGDANYVEYVYEDYCVNGTWDCVATPSSGGGGGEFNFGIYVTVFNPYADGPNYVDRLKQAGGWELVDEAMRNPPASTETVIHARTSDEAEPPATIDYEDTATDGWRTFQGQGVDGYDTVGEVSIYSMFWYASYPERAGGLGLDIVDWRALFTADGEFDLYNYSAPPSDGWAGDRVYPYTSANSDEDGYVWVTEWDTQRDAEQFRAAYLQVLNGLGAERVDENTWTVSGNAYADSFRVVVDGTRVVVVNGPNVDAVDAIKPEYASGATNATAPTNAVRVGA